MAPDNIVYDKSAICYLATPAFDPATDRDWIETVAVVLARHPGLSAQQKAAIALDYGMTDGECTIEVRRAFLYYLLKRLGLDDAPRRRRPEDQHIVRVNRKAIRQAHPGIGIGSGTFYASDWMVIEE